MDHESDMFTEDKEMAAYIKLKYKMPLKRFVQAKGCEDVKAGSASSSSRPNVKCVSGSRMKESYLNIVGNDSLRSCGEVNGSVEGVKMIAPKLPSKKKKFDLNVNAVMKAAEADDVNKVLEFLSADVDFVLNARDLYGWSVMMNACCAGAKHVVELLLQWNVDVTVRDKRGYTCLSLARAKRHKHIIQLLERYQTRSNDVVEINNISNTESSDSFYCDICKELVVSGIAKSHFTSTIHLFNSSRKSGTPTWYGIPESNVGFQMLLKTGWDREKGLGPEGSGHKFPPKTALKQDRAGLGAKKYVSRVTHDSDLVVRDRSERQRTLNRRQRLRNEMKSKKRERELRRMLD